MFKKPNCQVIAIEEVEDTPKGGVYVEVGPMSDNTKKQAPAVKTHMRALFESFEVTELPQNQKRVALVERALQSGLISEREL